MENYRKVVLVAFPTFLTFSFQIKSFLNPNPLTYILFATISTVIAMYAWAIFELLAKDMQQFKRWLNS